MKPVLTVLLNSRPTTHSPQVWARGVREDVTLFDVPFASINEAARYLTRHYPDHNVVFNIPPSLRRSK